MSLASLATSLRYERLPFSRPDKNTLVIDLRRKHRPRGGRKNYLLQVSGVDDKYLVGEIWFGRIAAHEIENVGDFCDYVTKEYGPPALDFDPVERRFFLSGWLDPDSYWDDVRRFYFTAAGVEPLCLTVGKRGKWIEDIDLMIILANIQDYTFGTIH